MSAHTGIRINRKEYYKDLGWEPREWQAICDKALDEEGKRFVAAFSFPRGGKSAWSAKYVGPRLLRPDHHAWIVAPTYELGSKEFFYIYDDLLNLGFLNIPGVRKSRDKRGGMFIEFPWGSFIRVASADRPESLRAEEFDDIILAEASALPAEILLHRLFIRVEKRGGNILIPTTPAGFNWVYDVFRVKSLQLLRGEENPQYDPLFFSLVISADPEMVVPDDPDLGDIWEPGVYNLEAVKRAKDILPTPLFIEQYGGGFASYAGVVFPFQPAIHECDPFSIPDDWVHVVGWDQGALPSPTAITVHSRAPNGHSYWWGEVLGDRPMTPIATHFRELKALLGNKKFSTIGVDPSAKQTWIELNNLGAPTTVSFDKSEMAGIVRLSQQMNERSFHLLRGSMPNFKRELVHFQWDPKIPKKTKDGKRFHFIASARYGSLATVQLPESPFPDLPFEYQNDPVWQAAWKEIIELRKRQHLQGYQDLADSDDPWEEDGPPEAFDPDIEEKWI